MNQRKLIRSLKLPQGSDASALAESLTDDFNVASIAGSDGEYEVQFVSPDALIVVISPSRARFFLEPHVAEDDDDDGGDDEDDDGPEDVAEMISYHLARRTGQLRDKDDDDSENDAAPVDDSDQIARRVMTRLLDEGLLELVTPRSRASVEEYLAHRIAHGRTGESLCDDLVDVKGVAELYASNEQLAEILAACRPKRAAAPARTPAEPKPRPAIRSKAPTTDKPRPEARRPRKGKK